MGGLTVGDLAYWADSILLWFLIRIAEAPFDTVLVDTEEDQLAHTFQVGSRSAGPLAPPDAARFEGALAYSLHKGDIKCLCGWRQTFQLRRTALFSCVASLID